MRLPPVDEEYGEVGADVFANAATDANRTIPDLRRMNADLVYFLASFEDVSRAKLDAEAAALASVIDYEDIGVPELEGLRG
jgi:hypothetical protein